MGLLTWVSSATLHSFSLSFILLQILQLRRVDYPTYLFLSMQPTSISNPNHVWFCEFFLFLFSEGLRVKSLRHPGNWPTWKSRGPYYKKTFDTHWPTSPRFVSQGTSLIWAARLQCGEKHHGFPLCLSISGHTEEAAWLGFKSAGEISLWNNYSSQGNCSRVDYN